MPGAESRRASAVLGAIAETVVWGGALFGVTVVSITSVGPVEVAVAGSAALGGALAARAIRRAAEIVPSGGRGALRAAAALPPALLRGCLLLMSATLGGPARLGGPDTGPGFRRIVLREGTGPAWAGLVLAASPDTCVIGMDGVASVDEVTVGVHVLRQEPNVVERAVARATR